jgi:hypothetical protein
MSRDTIFFVSTTPTAPFLSHRSEANGAQCARRRRAAPSLKLISMPRLFCRPLIARATIGGGKLPPPRIP